MSDPAALLYVGTQGMGPGSGIFAIRFDDVTGTMTPLGLVAEIDRPTWVLADPHRAMLYAVSEVGNAGDREGEVASFAIDRISGRLRELGRTASGGGGATHLALDGDAGALLVANFGGGPAAVIPIMPDGTLAPARPGPAHRGSGPHRRQQGPHPHGVTLDPSGRFVLVPDMGTDAIYVCRYDVETKTLAASPASVTPTAAGSGPRLVTFGSDGRFAYMLSELSAEVTTYRWEADRGRLVEMATAALDPVGAEGARSAAALTISRDGRRLYASNRRTDAIHVFTIDRGSGLLREVQQVPAGGAKPWAAELSPSGRWLVIAAQASDRIIPLAVDADTGLLAYANGGVAIPSPTGLAFA